MVAWELLKEGCGVGVLLVVAEEMERRRNELERVLLGRLRARRQDARVSCCAVSSEWSVWCVVVIVIADGTVRLMGGRG